MMSSLFMRCKFLFIACKGTDFISISEHSIPKSEQILYKFPLFRPVGQLGCNKV